MLSKTIRFLSPLILTSTIAGVVLGVLAPLGTDSMTLAGRLAYWICLCVAGALGAGAAEYLMSRSFKPKDAAPLSRWPLAAAQSIGATAMVSPFVFQIHSVANITSAAITIFYIWVVAMTISAVGALQKREKSVLQTPAAPSTPALFSRLKPPLRGSVIYALEAQDHYVRVITSAGEDLILMRLSDAISEISPLAGLSPHRSWWVAEAGLQTVSRASGKAVITLHNDVTVPVSRNQLKTLRAAAWI